MEHCNCCRLCLSDKSILSRIFLLPELSNKYTNIILNTTGVKIEPNDKLPQVMCSDCINFINSTRKFQKQCLANQNILLKRTDHVKQYESSIPKVTSLQTITKHNQIMITDSDEDDDDFNDVDNIPLSSLQNNNLNDSKYTPLDFVESSLQLSDEEGLHIKNKSINKDLTTSCDDKNVLENSLKENKRCSSNTKLKVTKTSDKALNISKNREMIGFKIKKTGKESIECEHCHVVLTSKLSLRNHYKIHTGFDYVCEHCGKKFINKRLLLMHCKAKHGYEKTDKCSFCDYLGSNAEQVKIHERLHTGEKPFACGSCGAKFHRNSTWRQHLATHLPHKSVQCKECPALFKSQTLLKIHVYNKHREKKFTYKCPLCDTKYMRRRNVVRHISKVHAESPDSHAIVRVPITW